MMNKKFKKIMSVMLAVVMLLTISIPTMTASAANDYRDDIIVDPDFIGSHWTYGQVIKIPFLLNSRGSGDKYYVYVYDEYQNKVASCIKYFPSSVGITNLTVSWDSYSHTGKYYVNFYASGNRDFEYDLFAFYIDPVPTVKSGWKNEGGNTYYYRNGSRVTGWQYIDNVCYYFGSNGAMYANGWYWIDGKCYYFYSNGKMASSTVVDGSYVSASGVCMKGNWVYDSYGCYYKHYDGVCTRNNFELIDGHWYYFNSYGYMTTGWQYVNGHYYYFNNYGVMVTGWLNINGYYYYMNASGAMATGWVKLNGYYYYMNEYGVMSTGWKYVNGQCYYFNNYGVMVTGWVYVNGHYYYMNNSGNMAIGWKYIDGYYYYFNNYGIMQTGWLNINGTYYYLNGYGLMQTGWQYINGNCYYFNSNGSMVAGKWMWIDGNCYYFYNWGGMAHNTWINGSYVNGSGKCIDPETNTPLTRFETIQFSGSGEGLVRQHINIPKGRYTLTISYRSSGHSSADWASCTLYDGDSDYIASPRSVNNGETTSEVFKGPVTDGYIETSGVYGGTWTITISAF